MSRLDLVVGPNGAGKSTFVRFKVAPARPGVPFVNADVIAAERWPDDPMPHACEAARLAAEARRRLVDQGRPFIAETVFSPPSEVQFVHDAVAAGFDVRLHVIMVPVELSVLRVGRRVLSGGHDVPEDKIRQRHERLWSLVVDALPLVAKATCWRNDADDPAKVATFHHGVLVGVARWPDWAPVELVRLG